MIIATVVCLVIPAIVTWGISSQLTKAELTKQTLTNVEGSMELVYQHVYSLINEMIYISNKIQFDSEINSLLIENRSFEKRGKKEDFIIQRWTNDKRINHLLNFVLITKSKYYITIISPDGTSYANYSYQHFNPESFFKEEEWYDKLQHLGALETYWVGLQKAYIPQDKEESPYFITIARALKGSFAEPYGYLFISIPESSISSAFQNYGQDQKFMIINNENTILSHTDPHMVGHVAQVDDYPVGEPNLIKMSNSEEFVLAKELSFGGWKLISIAPSKNILGFIKNLYGNINLIQIIIFLIFITAIILIIRKLTSSILKLSSVASQVNQGNLSVRSNIIGKDEIGKLGKSFDLMLDRVNHMIIQIKKEQEQKRKAELEMLQAQLNPHFLFNILNSIRMRILLKGDNENAELLSSLSSFLRMSINRNNEFISLSEELDTVTHYMKLINFRNKEEIDLIIRIPSQCLAYQVPRFILQPLIENAIFHGLEQGEGTIIIEVIQKEQIMTIAVRDNGRGMSSEEVDIILERLHIKAQPEGVSRGIGISNVYDRLNILFNSEFSMEIESEEKKGTKVTLQLPVKKVGDKFAQNYVSG
ncbi:histidine kinase [Bacillus sp. IITD106]|nr:histidine kinase [Bacillus sp. IITD106]